MRSTTLIDHTPPAPRPPGVGWSRGWPTSLLGVAMFADALFVVDEAHQADETSDCDDNVGACADHVLSFLHLNPTDCFRNFKEILV